MTKVFIVDDHALFRSGLRLILERADGITVVGEAESGEEALRVVKRLEPDLVLMDLQMPHGMGGIEATRRLVRLLPSCRVIALTMLGAEPFPDQLREAGAMGFLTKGCSADELLKAVQTVSAGRPYVDSAVAQARVLAEWHGGADSPFKGLSSRELQVAMLILDGRRNQEISESLSLSPKTVSTYRQRVYEKLGVHSDAELARLAIRHGLLSDTAGAP